MVATILGALATQQEDVTDLCLVLARAIGLSNARSIIDELDHAALLLWVRTRTPDAERKAARILLKHSGNQVRIHDLQTDHIAI